MFQIITLEDVVRIPITRFTEPLERVSLEILKAKYESIIIPEVGYVILVMKVKPEKMGKIVPGDGATYHKVTFSMLCFYPKNQEIVEGEVVEITDFGAFVRIGPVDALLHLSQIMDDYMVSDVRQGIILANQSKRILKVGSKVRVRIIAVSLSRGSTLGKIGVTCRQPFLGALEWIEEDIKKALEVKSS
ncbi:MAG: DNA-directed RNA polymerase [Nitrososphaerales archaeon]